MNCAYCGRPSEKEFSIDVELPMYGQRDVWICSQCAIPPRPTIEQIQAHVESMDPLIFELKLKRGEIGFVPETAAEEVTRLTPTVF